jgi:hypothetical protein
MRNLTAMNDRIGFLLGKVSGLVKRHDRQLQRLKLLQKYIPRIIKPLPNEYWSDLDGNAKDHVICRFDPAPDRITLYRPWPKQPKHDRVLRDVQLGRGHDGKLEVKDPGLFLDSTGRFYAYHHAREARKSWNGKQRHEVHVTEIREVEPDVEGFHRFERSLQPYLDVLVRPGWEHESKDALFGQITSGSIARKMKELFAPQPIDKIEKVLSLLVKFAGFTGFLIITWHMLELHYFPSMSGVGLAQIYLVVVLLVLLCILMAVIVTVTPFMFSRNLYSANVASARPRLHIAVTACQLVFFAVCCAVGTMPLRWWIQLSVAFCALLLLCAVIARIWFIGDHQLRSWWYRSVSLCAWSLFGLFAFCILSPAVLSDQRYLRPKTIAILVLWVVLLGMINWSQEVFIRESKTFTKELAILGIFLVCIVEVWLVNPIEISFRALGLGYLKNQRIYVDGPGRDQIYRQAYVTPLKSQTADWWYFDRVEIISRIGDPVMIVIPGTYEDGRHRTIEEKAIRLPLRDLILYEPMPPKLKTGQVPPG